MKRIRRSGLRRNDDNPDDFQPHNRAAAALLAAGAVGCVIAGIAICVATHRFHWAGLVADKLALLLAISTLVLRRSRLGYCLVALAILAFFASMLLPRWISAVG